MTDFTAAPITRDETPRFPDLLGFLRRCFTPSPVTDDTAQDARARTAFVQDMLCANPDAFANEHDVQCMMHHYPGRF